MRSTASAVTEARAFRGVVRRVWRRLREERGSAVAEWSIVAALLTLLFLTVLQLGFAMYVRAVAIDAAGEGARYAGLAGSSLAAGEARAREVLATALDARYADDVTATTTSYLGVPAVEVRVVAPLPLIGLVGLPAAMEVTGHAPIESLD